MIKMVKYWRVMQCESEKFSLEPEWIFVRRYSKEVRCGEFLVEVNSEPYNAGDIWRVHHVRNENVLWECQTKIYNTYLSARHCRNKASEWFTGLLLSETSPSFHTLFGRVYFSFPNRARAELVFCLDEHFRGTLAVCRTLVFISLGRLWLSWSDSPKWHLELECAVFLRSGSPVSVCCCCPLANACDNRCCFLGRLSLVCSCLRVDYLLYSRWSNLPPQYSRCAG